MRPVLKVALGLIYFLPTCSATSGPPCAPGQGFGAVDISYRTSPSFLKRLRSIGISTVIRYYDWPDETLPGKTLTIGELAQIKQNLLNVAVIFQHHNDKIATFEDPNRGVLDANISLDLARTFARYCWLANARSWPEYALFEATGRWSLKQSVSTKNCFGEEVDLNVMNGASANFGQWPP